MVSMSNATSRGRRKWITTICAIATIAGIVVGGVFLYHHLTGDAFINPSDRSNEDVFSETDISMADGVNLSVEENDLNVNAHREAGAPVEEPVVRPSEATNVDQGRRDNIMPEAEAGPVSNPINLSVEENDMINDAPKEAAPQIPPIPPARRNLNAHMSHLLRANQKKYGASSHLGDIEKKKLKQVKELARSLEPKKPVDGNHGDQAAPKSPKGPAAVPEVPCIPEEAVTMRAESIYMPGPEPTPSTSHAADHNEVLDLPQHRALGATANVDLKADDPLQAITFKPTCECFKHYASQNYDSCRPMTWIRTDFTKTNIPFATLGLTKLADALKCIYVKPRRFKVTTESKSRDCVDLDIVSAATNPNVNIINPSNDFMVMKPQGTKIFCTVKYKNRTLAVLKDVKAPQKMIVTKEVFNGGVLFSIWMKGRKSRQSMIQVILKNNIMYVNDHYVFNLLMFFGITLPNER